MSDVATVSATRRRVPRWVWIVLLLSLAANMFVIGAVARVVWPSRYAAAQAGAGGLFGNLMAYARELPPERRPLVRQPKAKERPHLTVRPLREEVRAARREAARLFRTDPFDREAFLAAEGRVGAAEAKLRQTLTQFAADIAGRMTATERADFLKWRELRRPGGPARQGDGDPDGATQAPTKTTP